MIKYKNHLLSPNEIEQALMINQAVTEVAVVPISHKKDGEWPIAFVKTIPGSKVWTLLFDTIFTYQESNH